MEPADSVKLRTTKINHLLCKHIERWSKALKEDERQGGPCGSLESGGILHEWEVSNLEIVVKIPALGFGFGFKGAYYTFFFFTF